MARLIAIDGLDGSGKGTQSEKLYDHLINNGKDARLISFPTYQEPASSLVSFYLSGGLGGAPEDTCAEAASAFFACDRYVSYRTDWKKDYDRAGCIVIANRYTTANAVHQLSKLPREKWDDFLPWLFDFEFNRLALPAPDDVVYLDVPVDISMSLVDSRGNKKDIHETAHEYLENSYAAAHYCADKLGWIKINCVKNGKLRTIDDIFEEMRKELSL